MLHDDIKTFIAMFLFKWQAYRPSQRRAETYANRVARIDVKRRADKQSDWQTKE